MVFIERALFDYDNSTGDVHRTSNAFMPTDWSDLVWAAVSVGRRSRFDILRFGFSSQLEIIWRAALIRANLVAGRRRLLSTPGFERSDAFWALDPSEKGAVTYFFGLALAKLAAEQEYDVPWLLHLDVYSRPSTPYGNPIQVIIPTGRSRPDLVGQSRSASWLIMESKGRTGTVSDDLRIEAKEQTRLISTVNGQVPRNRIAALTYFRGRALAIDLVDPPDAAPDAAPLEIPPEIFLLDYYALVIGLLTDNRDVVQGADEGIYVSRYIPEVDLSIGLDKRIFIEVTQEGADALGAELHQRVLSIVARRRDPISSPDERIGLDGIRVQLGRSWLTD